jgi:hypothetical protein
VRDALQVAFLTGQSDPRTCRLSESQTAFMRALPIPDGAKRWRNFPYADETAPFVRVPLVIASYRNGLQYFASRRGAFRIRRQPAVLAFLARAERTVFLAGSCGLEFLNNLALPAGALARIAVFAYGPVARRRPACAHVLVGSPRDAISRRYFPQPDVSVNATHLDYLTSPDVAATCRAFIGRVIRAEI